ncbi:hypothetical protein GCM10011529_27860 [Polymorphobacter glacialis]|uniref:Uncharacterized protein n=1 Tax=Sandarakinorhabdus glacialis TaxID=1614636 RepID=A0A917ECP2_9SPHN|nr:hypothetical protein GCM10011529_27860 [Polymorphobacter glacialis]
MAADFVLKNGAMHIIETVDAATEESSARKLVSDIAVSALVLEQSRMNFGINNTRSKIVFDISSSLDRLAAPSLMAAEHQGAELFNWASDEDRKRLIESVTNLAIPYEDKRRKNSSVIHTSRQSRFRLN